MRHALVKIIRDTQTVTSKGVPEWEVAILEFIFEGNVHPMLDKAGDPIFETLTDRDYPTAASEFDRLTRCYGEDPQNGVPYVAAVYGQAGAGIRSLGRAIADAKAAEAASESKPAARKARATRDVSADSLLS